MDPELIAQMMAAQDATANPRNAARGPGLSIGELLSHNAGIVRDAVVGLPSVAVDLFQDFQRNPLSFTPIGDAQASSEALAGGEIGKGLGLAMLGLLGTPMPERKAMEIFSELYSRFRHPNKPAVMESLADFIAGQGRYAESPQVMYEGMTGPDNIASAISGLPTERVDQLMNTAWSMRMYEDLDDRVNTALEFISSRGEAEVLARAGAGDETALEILSHFGEYNTPEDLLNELRRRDYMFEDLSDADELFSNYEIPEGFINFNEVNRNLNRSLSDVTLLRFLLESGGR